MQSVLIEITPEIAKRFLKYNTSNRNLNPTTTTRYTNDMKNGRWMETGDPIRFAGGFEDPDNMKLLDGQHRLQAIVESKVTIPTFVITGLEDDVQLAMDQGRTRTAGDQLGLLGYSNPDAIAATTRQYLVWQGGYLFERRNKATAEISKLVIQQWVNNHPEMVDNFLENINPRVSKIDAPNSVIGALFMKFYEIDPVLAELFITQLAEGGAAKDSPINILDQKLRRMRRDKITRNDADNYAFFIITWNHLRTGKRLTRLSRPIGSTWSQENFPRPV